MEWLTGLDIGLLYSESLGTPLDVVSVIERDTSTIPGGDSLDRFQNHPAAKN
jgi:hypothetical protein